MFRCSVHHQLFGSYVKVVPRWNMQIMIFWVFLTSKHFYAQLIIINNFVGETKSLSSVVLKFCEVVPGWNMPKHPEIFFFGVSPRIMRFQDFSKKKMFWRHQLVTRTFQVLELIKSLVISSNSTTFVKNPKL